MKIVIALGGNALARPEQEGTYDEQVANVRVVCRQLAEIIKNGHQVVVTHGNGPQVGNLAIQGGATKDVPELPLHVLDAMTQGEIGYLIQRELGNALEALGVKLSVASVVTQVLVDVKDPAFDSPSKPIGPFYDETRAKMLAKEKGFVMKKVDRNPGRPYRRVVPSPDPVHVVEERVIAGMIREGYVVVAGGGGGIPVVKNSSGRYEGVDAVIDKDLCAEKIAEAVGADCLLILTNVEKLMAGYGTPKAKSLDSLTVKEAKRLLAQGEFPPGTMGPKVLACLRFVEWRGGRGIIASLAGAVDALAGRSGTRITPG
ncbi:MAG: carbamate kinase [Thaumarchaeota archaeon]|nr:carbamate kinase [Nitrososphaerota archaeon]